MSGVNILSTLRGEIVGGRLRPGERLANRTELERRFGCSSHTVQRAMSQLMRDGFVVARGRAGTFVAERPPHSSRYGLVFPIHLDAAHGGTWARLWGTLDRQAARLRRERGLDLVSYYEVIEHADTEDWQRLQGDLAAHRLAGLILASPNHLPDLERLLAKVPCVGFQVEAWTTPKLPTVHLNQREMIDCALAHLVERNCRRVAVLALDVMSAEMAGFVQNAIQEHGLESQPQWVLGVNPRFPHWTANCVHAMLHRGQAEAPDALLVADDALLDGALAGLMDLGLRPGRDLEVVAHANFPLAETLPWPITRVGFDIAATLDIFLDLLDRQIRGDGGLPATTVMPALLDQPASRPPTEPATRAKSFPPQASTFVHP